MPGRITDVLEPLVFDGRDNAHVGLALGDGVRAAAGDGQLQFKFTALLAVEHAPNQRNRVEILNDRQAQGWHDGQEL